MVYESTNKPTNEPADYFLFQYHNANAPMAMAATSEQPDAPSKPKAARLTTPLVASSAVGFGVV